MYFNHYSKENDLDEVDKDQQANYISILEQDLDRAEQEISALRMEDEQELVDRDHELAWLMEWNRNSDAQAAFLESQLDAMEFEKDQELAEFMDYRREEVEKHFEIYKAYLQAEHELALLMEHRRREIALNADAWNVLQNYVAHFKKHPLGYMSSELRKITDEAREVVAR